MLLLGDHIELPVRAIREVRDETGATWPTHEVIQGKPRRQYMGPSGTRLTVSLFFHASFIVPHIALGVLRDLSTSGTTFQLWTRAGTFLGTYFIEQIASRATATLPDGRPICATCEITLSEPGLELPESPDRPLALDVTAVDTFQIPTSLEDLERLQEDFSPQEIARV